MQIILNVGCIAALLLIGAGLLRLAQVISRSGITIKLLAQEAEGQELSGKPETTAGPNRKPTFNPFKWKSTSENDVPLPAPRLVNNGQPNVITDEDELVFEQIAKDEEILDKMRGGQRYG